MNEQLSPLDVVIGAILRKRRKAAGLSQETLAAKTGRHQVTVSLTEAGKRHMLVVDLKAYAQALGCPVVRLLPAGWRK